jgi:diguanylate cyclase (GGDEF)-like protein
MQNSALEKILACTKLPTLPAVAIQVLELTRSENVDLQNVASVIRNDQALATKVLRTVNSSYYGLTKPCATIRHAMVYLGLNTIKTIVLGFSLTDNLQSDGEDGGFNFIRYWRRGLCSAAAARELARRTGVCPPEEAFLAALFQDVGMIAIHRAVGDDYLAVIADAGIDHRRLPALEREALQTDHAEIGGALAGHWKLPEQLIETVRHHHRPDDASPQWRPLARLVELGGLVAASLTLPDPGGAVASFAREGSQWFNLTADDTRHVLGKVKGEVAELSQLFNLRTGEIPDADAILLAAEERLVEHQAQMEKETRRLRESNEALARETLADPLTGLANRKHLDRELGERFRQAREFSGMLGLVFCDVDRFKSLNDTHGHQAGDAVLASLASLMMRHVGDAGLVARYGGEEFAIVLPGHSRAQATAVADGLRQAVESHPFDLGDADASAGPLSVTVSLGVAAYEPATAGLISKPESLVRLADQAVYAAKGAGRNCVKVFSPAAKKVKAA